MNERLDEPDGIDLDLLAERQPNCPVCGVWGELVGESVLRGPGGAKLKCVNRSCPALDPDDGPEIWEVFPDE